jgi:hypothetical protein
MEGVSDLLMCMADGYPKFIPIEQEANHQIGHAFRLRKAHRPMCQPLDPCAQVNMLRTIFWVFAFPIVCCSAPTCRSSAPHPSVN